jgi:hypothetical protein
MKRANDQQNSVRSLLFAFSVLSIAAVCLWLVAGMNRTEAQKISDETTKQSVSPAATFAANPATLGAIPDGTAFQGGAFGPSRDVTFDVSGITGSVSNVSVSFNVNHTWLGDVDVVLKAPGGSPSHVIFSRTGATTATSFGSGAVLNSANTLTFNDAAFTNWWSQAITMGTGGTMPASNYRTTAPGGAGQTSPAPVTNLNAAFNSVANPNGTWTLSFRDGASTDTGAVTAATLTIEGSSIGSKAKPCFDFYGSGRTSFTTVNLEGNQIVWRIRNNGGAGSADFGFGLGTDLIAPGYYDDDNIADPTVYRRGGSPGVPSFYYSQTSTTVAQGPNRVTAYQWGANSDAPQREGDYDGDGRDDFTVIRVEGSAAWWYILRSSDNTFIRTQFGLPASDVFAAGADYNGDGRDDLTVMRIAGNGAATYIVGDSITGNVILTQQWGNYNTDFFIIGDFIGDGRADFATWRGFGSGTNGAWQIKENGGSGQIYTVFGIPGSSAVRDIAVCGDYDGDGKSDIAVYRPSNKTFYWLTNPTDTTTMQSYTMTFPEGTAPFTDEVPVAAYKVY